MKFTELTEILPDINHLPSVGLADYVAWCSQEFPCGHPKFGSNVIWDGETQRCRTCRRDYQTELRAKKNHQKTSTRKSHKRGGKYA